ncbi:tetraacyldisaccharide 4'-kinase [Flavobacterium sp.]|jgi:tetraacyldisaccharide 4'-kinase|uniref:tetraacyldisaccharide 4'-kinase n=1 Tax=Flavobacterium sp. TaxID=239 RepID=UPI0037C09A50
MMVIRKLLFPLGVVYWLVTFIRNWLYDLGIFTSKSYDLPIIAIGNLSAGGTGKTPQTEYIIRLLKNTYKIAVLSRGYKRSTKGFLLANDVVTSSELGDESFQMYSKFPEISVAVCEDRQTGIENLISKSNPDIILLDDAFQHRKVKAGFYILLTSYDDLFSDDYILPFGNLRESAIGKKRAHVVVVTKCPQNIKEKNKDEVKLKLNVNVPVFFTSIDYDSDVFSTENSISVSDIISKEKIIVAGIAKPKYFVDYLNSGADNVIIYPDHHNFSDAEISEISELSKDKIIVTTEKDFMRLNRKIHSSNLFYLPIQTKFNSDKEQFDSLVTNWVKSYTT